MLMRIVSMQSFIASYILCKHLTLFFDIIAISETWAELIVTTEYDLPHYQVFHRHEITKMAEVLLYISITELNVLLLKANQLSLKIF